MCKARACACLQLPPVATTCGHCLQPLPAASMCTCLPVCLSVCTCSAVAARASVVNSTKANLPLGSQRASRTCRTRGGSLQHAGWQSPARGAVASSTRSLQHAEWQPPARGGGSLQHTQLAAQAVCSPPSLQPTQASLRRGGAHRRDGRVVARYGREWHGEELLEHLSSDRAHREVAHVELALPLVVRRAGGQHAWRHVSLVG